MEGGGLKYAFQDIHNNIRTIDSQNKFLHSIDTIIQDKQWYYYH